MGRVKKSKDEDEEEDKDNTADTPTGEGKASVTDLVVDELLSAGQETDDKDKELAELYYSPKGFWRGKRAVNKLHEATGRPKKKIIEWLEKQPIYQIYKPPPIYISRAKFREEKPNAVHQADLLYLPEDKVDRKIYKYCLVVVDVASRYKDACPLQNRSSNSVAEGFRVIYERGPLKWPNLLQVDGGAEFRGVVSRDADDHGTQMRVGIRGNHRQQGIVERFNRTLGERIFTAQYHEEIKDPSKRSKKWVEALPELLKDLNGNITRLTGIAPKIAITQEKVESKPALPPPSNPNLEPLESHDVVRYLYSPGELEGWTRRATDPIWSLTTHNIKSVDEIQGIYWLGPDIKSGSEAPPRSFVRAELLLIPHTDL